MNAYVSVITKTIEAQRDKSFETRSRIYAKARQTIEEKLHREIASKYVAVRQLTLLDEAITAVEDQYKDRYKESSNDLFPPTYTSVEDAIKYMVPPPLAGGPKFEIVDNLLSWKPIHATNSETQNRNPFIDIFLALWWI